MQDLCECEHSDQKAQSGEPEHHLPIQVSRAGIHKHFHKLKFWQRGAAKISIALV
jgi:hypothetical protein